jgi:hypothetical protein
MLGVGCWYPFVAESAENGGCEAPIILDKYEAHLPVTFANYAQNQMSLTHNIEYYDYLF